MYYNPNHMVPVDPYAGQFAPQGAIGDAISYGAPIVGGLVGGATTAASWGNPILGGLAGGAATVATRAFGDWLPYNAGPQMGVPAGYAEPAVYAEPAGYAPQGVFGRFLGRTVGGVVGNHFGNRGAGQAVGGAIGNLLPFQAGPGGMPVSNPYGAPPEAFAPQGVFGRFLGRTVGGAIGNHFGNRGAGQEVGGALGNLLPFQAGPGGYVEQPAAYAPQGWFGDLAAKVAPVVGNHVGGNWGRVITNVGGLADMLPFQAGPGGYVEQPAAYAPQGWFGDLAAKVAPVVGNHVGGNWGRVITNVGGLADMLPFQAGPGGYPQQVAYSEPQMAYAPQGLLGGFAGGAVGGWIGKKLGNQNLGRAIGGGLGALLPFDAYGQPIQGQPMYGQPVYGQPMIEPQTDQIVYH